MGDDLGLTLTAHGQLWADLGEAMQLLQTLTTSLISRSMKWAGGQRTLPSGCELHRWMTTDTQALINAETKVCVCQMMVTCWDCTVCGLDLGKVN